MKKGKIFSLLTSITATAVIGAGVTLGITSCNPNADALQATVTDGSLIAGDANSSLEITLTLRGEITVNNVSIDLSGTGLTELSHSGNIFTIKSGTATAGLHTIMFSAPDTIPAHCGVQVEPGAPTPTSLKVYGQNSVQAFSGTAGSSDLFVIDNFGNDVSNAELEHPEGVESTITFNYESGNKYHINWTDATPALAYNFTITAKSGGLTGTLPFTLTLLQNPNVIKPFIITSSSSDYVYCSSNKINWLIRGDHGDALSEYMIENGYNAIEFDSSIHQIGENAFTNCSILKSIYTPTAIIFKANDMKIDKNAFSGCNGLTRIDMLAVNKTFHYIDEDAFANCESLTGFGVSAQDVKITTIEKSAFAGCPSLTIPGIRIYSIGGCHYGEEAEGFYWIRNGTSGIEDLYTAGCLAVGKIDVCPFTDNRLNDNQGYGGCASITEISVNFTWLGNLSLNGCTKLVKFIDMAVMAPGNVIKESTFRGCSNLKIIQLGGWNPTGAIVTDAFNGCNPNGGHVYMNGQNLNVLQNQINGTAIANWTVSGGSPS